MFGGLKGKARLSFNVERRLTKEKSYCYAGIGNNQIHDKNYSFHFFQQSD